VETNCLTVDSLQIFAGQRYSFILHTNQPVNNYWIRANPGLGATGFADGINSAILRYAGAPNAEPTTNQTTSVDPLVETSLSPLQNPGVPGKPFPGGADVNLNLNIVFNTTALRFFINGASFIPPPVPVLLQILSGAKTAQELLPTGSVYLLPPNKSIEVSIPGGAPGFPVSLWFNVGNGIRTQLSDIAPFPFTWGKS
jgi:iron transport multicopper oxidase